MRCAAEVGSTMVDLMVSVGITSLLLGVSVITLKGSFTDLSSSAQTLAGDIRRARMYAVTRGAHYRMTFASTWFKSERLQDNDNDGVWQVDTNHSSPQRNLQGGITMAANTGNSTGSGAGATPVIEFDSRGMVVPKAGTTVPGIMTIAVQGDAGDSMVGTLYVYVWPSGQVELLTSGEVHP
jgi:Tfp pilus assembly protein FimT